MNLRIWRSRKRCCGCVRLTLSLIPLGEFCVAKHMSSSQRNASLWGEHTHTHTPAITLHVSRFQHASEIQTAPSTLLETARLISSQLCASFSLQGQRWLLGRSAFPKVIKDHITRQDVLWRRALTGICHVSRKNLASAWEMQPVPTNYVQEYTVKITF